MKHPIKGTFTITSATFNEVCISNGLLEALESGNCCLVGLPQGIAFSSFSPFC